MRRAQTAPDSPASYRALANAHEEVLAERGASAQDDSVLHRFLLRLAGEKREHEGLIPRFRRVLDDIGIVVEVNEDGEGIELTTELEGVSTGAQYATSPAHPRRSSLDSLLDGSADKIAGTIDVAIDNPLRSRRLSRAPELEAGWRGKRRSQSDTEVETYTHAHLPIRAGMNGFANQRANFDHYKRNHRRTASASTLASPQLQANGPFVSAHIHENDGDDSEHTDYTAEFDLANVQIPGINAPIPDTNANQPHGQQYVPEPFHLSDTRLMDDAEAFMQQRLHSLTRVCLQKWRDRTRERSAQNQEMARAAIAYNHRIVQQRAFQDMREQLNYRNSNRETDRFFSRLEGRAEKARSLFLLTKAFTHWAKSAEDEAQRTSVARRHILRTRFFNGWREITAVNELKIQHFILEKFLRKWWHCLEEARAKENAATKMHRDALLRRYYKEWFFKFCASAVPAWHDARLKKNIFEKWHDIVVILKDRERWAVHRSEGQAQRQIISIWKQKTTAVKALVPQAEVFHRRKLLTTVLTTLQKQARLSPLLARFQADSRRKLLRSTFQNWRNNAQLSRQAKNVNLMRVLRNAWTAWNDCLRIKVLEERINDRVLVEAMYRWTLASRVSLFQRVHDRTLLEKFYSTWSMKTNERQNTLDAAERRFAHFKRTQRLSSCLHKLESATAEKRAEGFAVAAQYQQKLKERVFDKLLDKHDHFKQLNKWAGDARFYVLATRALKSWNEATQHARRNRRRDAYTHIRRQVKIRVVRQTFSIWKDRSNAIAEQEQQANRMVNFRASCNIRILLTRWHDQSRALVAQETQATQQRNDKTQTRYLQIWNHRMMALQIIDAQAIAFRQESTEVAAASAFRKLGWRLWNVRRQEENASALHQRNFEKHLRAMIRFWHEQTVERIGVRPASPTPTRPRREPSIRDEDEGDNVEASEFDGINEGATIHNEAGDETRRLETWTAFDESALGLNNLDLSLSLSPQFKPPPQPSVRRSLPSRPQTYPQPRSVLRAPPPPIPEDLAFDETAAFWTSTPLPPATSKPGYLKTPSKRSVARSKRTDILASPEKRAVGLDRVTMSAPPGAGLRVATDNHGPITSFERRLRDGGFGYSPGVIGSGFRPNTSSKGKAKVEFGDVSHFG